MGLEVVGLDVAPDVEGPGEVGCAEVGGCPDAPDVVGRPDAPDVVGSVVVAGAVVVAGVDASVVGAVVPG